MVPCVIFEDEHLLVVHKPAGWNTHAPGPYAGEGIYDWLRHREPRWAIARHPAPARQGNQRRAGLRQNAGRQPLAHGTIHGTPRPQKISPAHRPRRAATRIHRQNRAGSRGRKIREPAAARGRRNRGNEIHEPVCRMPESRIQNPELQMLEAEPFTGRTHQIRVHAAESGFPILGDTLYGGTPAARVFLHAAEISFTHPATGKPVTFQAPADFVPLRSLVGRASSRAGKMMVPAARRSLAPPFRSALGPARRAD